MSSSVSLEGTILVVPIVSTANLPQLAVDLLVSSLQFERVAILDKQAKYLIPIVGAREDGKSGVTTPLELFGKPGSPCIFVHQRSPVMQSRRREFIESFTDFVVASKFSSVLFLAGLDLTDRPDAHMSTPAYYLSDPSAAVPFASRLSATLPPFILPGQTNPLSAPSPNPKALKLPSSGLAVPLLRALQSHKAAPPAATILQYVLEGDNREDALLLSTITARVLGLEQFNWKEPTSWKQGLFGAPHDQTLFG